MSEVLLFTEHQGHLESPTPQTLTEQDLGQPLGLLLDGMDLLFIQPPSMTCHLFPSSNMWAL